MSEAAELVIEQDVSCINVRVMKKLRAHYLNRIRDQWGTQETLLNLAPSMNLLFDIN